MAPKRYVFPFEALSSLALIGVFMGGGAWIVQQTQKWENYGKPKRWNVDRWDRRMMERDSRLTGNVNRQMAQVEAPEQFARNSAYEMEMDVLAPGPLVKAIYLLTNPILSALGLGN